MRRRDFIIGVAGAAAWPLAARAQQQAMPVIGYLNTQSLNPTFAEHLEALRLGLSEFGFVEGRNLRIEYRWAENRYDRLPALAAELVGRKVSVIVAVSGPAAIAAKQEAGAVPVVFSVGDLDPVVAGLVASLNRPGGTVTGVVPIYSVLNQKRLGLLHQMVPSVALIAMLSNPAFADATEQVKDIQDAAHKLGIEILVINTSNADQIDAGFDTIIRRHAGALIVAADPFFSGARLDQIVVLAARHALPAIYQQRAPGGLMSYGPKIAETYRQAGIYTARILKGEKPADLPVVRSTRFEFVINLATAKAIGIDVPPTVLALADEVIE